MTFDSIFAIISAVVALALFVFWIAFPIRRDRMLFAGKGLWMLVFSFCVIASIIGILYISTFRVSAESILTDGQQAAGGNRLWAIISQFADPGNLPSSKEKGAIVALICAFSGIICLSGLLVSSLVSIISRRTDQWRRGEIHYRFPFRNFVIIIGSNEQAATIIKDSLKKRGVRYVLIQTRKEVEKERHKLGLKLDEKEEKRVVFYAGERTSYEDIKKLHLHRAKEIFILGENMEFESEQDHDAFNINCLELISSYIGKRPRLRVGKKGAKLKCYVDLEYQSTYTVFKSMPIYSTLDKRVEFIPFNVHEIWAKKVLVHNYAVVPAGISGESKVYRYLPLEGEDGIQHDTDKTVHLIVVGMNKMGTALAMQAALLLHFPNFESDPSRKRRTTITFIDDQAVRESEFLMGRFSALFELARYRVISSPDKINGTDWTDPVRQGRYAHLGENFMDVQWEFIQGNVASSDVQKYMCSIAEDRSRITTIAVCFNNPQQSIATAVYLPEIILKRVYQVLVYQQNSFDLITKVSTGEKQWKRFAKLRPFGMVEGCYKGGQFDAETAKLTYYIYKNKSLPPFRDDIIRLVDRWWGEMSIVEKLSNVNASDSYKQKLRSMPDQEAVFSNEDVFKYHRFAEHNRWLTERLTFGFRPLDKAEREALSRKGTPKEREQEKRRLIAKYRAHLDICSNRDIEIYDPGTRKNETMILKSISALFDLQYWIICRKAYLGRRLFGKQSDVQEFLVKGMVNMGCFSIGRTPVTQAQWEMIMGKESNISGHRVISRRKRRYPVETVSWDDVQDFICILNDRTGLNFRLPTVPEWKLAASEKQVSRRGPVCSKHPNHPLKRTKKLGRHVNSRGLQDILGNVWEWTTTPCRAGDEIRRDDSAVVDEKEVMEPEKMRFKIDREKLFWYCGGSWRFGALESDIGQECWKRNWIRSFRSPDLGFRLVLPFGISRSVRLGDQDHMDDLEEERWDMIQELKFDEQSKKTVNSNLVTVFKWKGGQDSVPEPLFKIGRTPVTQFQWKLVMGELENNSVFRGDDLPVENVTFKDVQKFIKKLNRLTGGKFRLPTVKEWEYVARGGCFARDFEYAGSSDPKDVAWFFENARSTRPVKTKEPVNIAFGKGDDPETLKKYNVYDMCGNVWEWCSDWKGEGKNSRIVKGGSWKFDESYARIAYETDCIEEYKSDDLGFRLVADIL